MLACILCGKKVPKVRLLADEVEDWRTLPCFYCKAAGPDYIEDVRGLAEGLRRMTPEQKKAAAVKGGNATYSGGTGHLLGGKEAAAAGRKSGKIRREAARRRKREAREDKI